MHRDTCQPSLARSLSSRILGQGELLERITEAVAWERLDRFVATVGRLGMSERKPA